MKALSFRRRKGFDFWSTGRTFPDCELGQPRLRGLRFERLEERNLLAVGSDDIVRYMVDVFQQDGTTRLPADTEGRYLVGIGETFQIRGFVQDNRCGAQIQPPFNTDIPSGVFAAYLDLLFDNRNLFQIRYGETQRLNVTAPEDSGSFTLTFNGQTTASIFRGGSTSMMRAAIQTRLESLATVGAGNVEVTIPLMAGGNPIFDIRFKGALGEANQPAIVVTPNFTSGTATITDNFHPADPTDQGTFQSSFNLNYSPYLMGRSAIAQTSDEDTELAPATGTVFGEVGAFLDYEQSSTVQQNPGDERLFFSVDVKATAAGTLGIWASPADTPSAATMVFINPDNPDPGDALIVNPANIGFVQNPTGTALHTDSDDPSYLIQHNSPLDSAHKINILIQPPITLVDDRWTVLEDGGTTAITVLQNDTVDTDAGGVGSLVLTGLSSVTPTGSATIAIVDSRVDFTPTLNYNGPLTFTYTAQDQATPPHTGTGTVTVEVMPDNDAPVITLMPLPGPIDEDQGTVPLPAGTITVADVDAWTGLLQATISVTGGTLTLDGTSGLNFITGDGNADANMVFTGFLGALNNAANSVTFHTADDFNGTATVAITIDDQGSTGGGGPKSDTKTLAIPVTPINDPPVNTVPTAQTVMGLDTQLFAPPLSTTDVEAVAENQFVQVNLSVSNGKLELGSQTGLTNVMGLGTDAASFRGTVADVNAALATLTYHANTFPQNDALTITTSDLGTSPLPVMTRTDEVLITVVPSSKPSAVPDTASVAEDSGPTTVDVLANDIDVNSLVGPTNLIITTASDPAGGTVTVAADGKSFTYRPDDDFFGIDKFNYTITSTLPDMGDGPSTSTVFVTVNGINDSPTITMPPTGVTTDEDTVFTFAGANKLEVTDIDADAATTNPGVLVTVSVGHGTLAPGSTTNVTIATPAPGTLTIAGKVADVNAALNGATYAPTQNWDQADSLQFTVDDRGNTGGGNAPHTDTRAIPITINPVNDAPVTTLTPLPGPIDEDQGTVPLPAGTIAVTDVDAGTGLLQATIAVTGGTLTLNDKTGLNFSTGDGDVDNNMVFTGVLTALNNVANSITFSPTQDFNGTATVMITVDDQGEAGAGGSKSDTKTLAIPVTPINDSPTITMPPIDVTTAEDTPLEFAQSGPNKVAVNDIDADTLTVTLSVTHGTLAPGSTANVTIATPAPGTLTIAGKVADVNAALNGATYVPAQNWDQADSLQFTVDDGGGTGGGNAPHTDTRAIRITINPVNDNPKACDDELTAMRNVLSVIDVLANDNDVDGTIDPTTVTIVDGPNHGTVNVNPVTGRITFTSDYVGLHQFTYQVKDDGGALSNVAAVNVTTFDDESLDLGQVDFRRLQSLTPGGQELRFRLETIHNGWLTVQSVAEWTPDQLTLTLCDPGNPQVPLATSNPSDAKPRFDYLVEEGQIWLLKAAGVASDATLLLANLVCKVGSAVTVYGTAEADELTFDAAASRGIAINGVGYHYEDIEVSTVDFNGGDGWDTVSFYDSPGNENLEAGPDQAVLVNGAGDGEQDYSIQVSGIENLLAYATRGGIDSALLHGSENADKLKSYGDSVRLCAAGYTLRAKEFDTVAGDSGAAGEDVAVFYDSDGDETFNYSGAANSAQLQSSNRDHTAIGFNSITVRAGDGGNDVAWFTDLPASNEVFYFKSHKTQLVTTNVNVTVRAFDEIHATADQSGFDVARIHDTTGDDLLEVAGDTARLYRRNGTELDLLYEIIGFERVKAYRTQGNDTTDIGNHIIDLLLFGWVE